MSLFLYLFSQNQVYDIKNGEKKYTSCISCHGKDGLGKESQKAPRINNQYQFYIEKQLRDIQLGISSNGTQGRRGGEVSKMAPFVKNLTDKDIEDLSYYIATTLKN